MLDTWLDEIKVVAATYRPDLHTYELQVRPDGSTATHTFVLNNKWFPKHPAFRFLDEEVQIHEEVKVILKDEKELELINLRIADKNTKLLKHPKSPFLIGKKKAKMLGQLFNGKIGITEQMTPYVFIDNYRFGPNEVKCLIKANDLKIPENAKTIKMPSNYGNFSYNSEKHNLTLPIYIFTDAASIHALISFLRKAKLV